MMTVKHGGNREQIAAKTGIAADKLVDFSANINPLGLSPKMKQVLADALDEVVYYPNPDYPELKQAIGQHFNVTANNVFVGNGAVQMIFDAATALKAREALVLVPTFGEYERSLTRAGAHVSHFKLKPENDFAINVDKLLTFLDAHSEVDLICLCNPNNPSGQMLLPADVKTIAEYCRTHHIWLIVDEAFMDFVEGDRLSVIPHLDDRDPVVVIRSATKFFAIPGLRLGFLVTKNPVLRTKLSEQEEPWTVNIFAQRFGEKMYQDTEYITKTQQWLGQEKQYLFNALQQISYLTVFPSRVNYYLFRSDIVNLREKLWQSGIMIRDCSDYVGLDGHYYRVAVRSHEENQQLIAGLKALL
ncbi:threonine-phosphate decarboxylase CobD [Secundilactobacillus hailunensis]|uniref:threonine-phosphate decarboxylase n=1 Tax=Secundilactobacillus hailunensis TaxID=2559923 RepID=A0ABW1T7J3_9LACO|nr:threonine-phosphate decarboxylase CobD [Secundilactobacillus hailunensis]